MVGMGGACHVTQCRTGMHDIEPYHRGHVTKKYIYDFRINERDTCTFTISTADSAKSQQ